MRPGAYLVAQVLTFEDSGCAWSWAFVSDGAGVFSALNQHLFVWKCHFWFHNWILSAFSCSWARLLSEWFWQVPVRSLWSCSWIPEPIKSRVYATRLCVIWSISLLSANVFESLAREEFLIFTDIGRWRFATRLAVHVPEQQTLLEPASLRRVYFSCLGSVGVKALLGSSQRFQGLCLLFLWYGLGNRCQRICT